MMMGITMKAMSDNIFRDRSGSNPNVIKKTHQGQIGQLLLGKFVPLKDNEKVHRNRKIVRLFGCINLHKEDLDLYTRSGGTVKSRGGVSNGGRSTTDTYMPMYTIHLPGHQLG